ncbi:MAG: helix-turn-helix transcriptional regulator [Flavobacteriales bacterium]|nr:helix-turn-helix transcriptional regulator [Flavobacteriales bacterium]
MDIKPRQLEIMEAAGQLMTESGYAALTTKRLAERMGFSEPALYRHFKNKEDPCSPCSTTSLLPWRNASPK